MYNPITTLKPPGVRPQNPIKLLRMLTRKQWAFFGVALAGWTWDAFDYFTVSLALTNIATDLKKTTTQMSWAITLALMTRSIGATFFGILSDRYGRKWPFVANVLLYSLLELCTGFVSTFKQFLVVRALFGIAMGGIYGACASTALEDAPVEARGILSGLLQQGYALGNLFAAAFYYIIVPHSKYSWRALCWFGAGPAVLIALWRACLPETDAFIRAQEAKRIKLAAGGSHESAATVFIKSAKPALKESWPMLIYLVLMMAGMNFLSHGSQDLYPSKIKLQNGFDAAQVTVTTISSNCGAIIGGTLFGWASTFVGRRLSILIACVLGLAFVYPWAYTSSHGIYGAAFAEQFCVQGAWGVIPIHLMELSPPAFRAFVVGTSYQLGNLVSSASSTIEASIGTNYPLPPLGKTARYDYGKVMAIFIACVYGYLILIIGIGPERRNANDAIDDDVKNYNDELDMAQTQTYPSGKKAGIDVETVEHAVQRV